jgi:hypothetical protein
MQWYMEHEWPALYRQHHHRELVNPEGMILLPAGVRQRYASLCARAVLWLEHVSSIKDNANLDLATFASSCRTSSSCHTSSPCHAVTQNGPSTLLEAAAYTFTCASQVV